MKRLVILVLLGGIYSLMGQDRMVAGSITNQWPTIHDFEKEKGINVASYPIRTDLEKAVVLGVHNLNSQFDRDKDNEPYFYCFRREDGSGEMRHAVEIGIPHVVGRSMLGSQIAAQKVGVPFPKEGFDIYEHYTRQAFDNPDHLNSYYAEGERGVELHNMREGLWSLWALIAGRNSEWARDKAAKMLVTLQNITDERGRWSVELGNKKGIERLTGTNADNQARMIDPLLAYYEVSKDENALKLAGDYANVGLRDVFETDGKFKPFGQSSGHIHSITSSLSGIIQYAVLVNDTTMLNSCRKIMDSGVPDYFSTWGWGDEVMPTHPANVVSQGEINQVGDVVRSAIYLGAAGYTSYYELAERFVRGMILPAQFWMEDLVLVMKENTDPKDDSEKDILNRCLGGYGFPRPNGRLLNEATPVETQDITSGAIHALSEFWEHRITGDGKERFLNFHFDVENEDFVIKSLLPKAGNIQISAKSNKALFVRIPNWVSKKSIKLTVNGTTKKLDFSVNYLKISGLKKGGNAQLAFDVPCKTEREMVDGFWYETMWIGNQVIRIKQSGVISPLPF